MSPWCLSHVAGPSQKRRCRSSRRCPEGWSQGALSWSRVWEVESSTPTCSNFLKLGNLFGVLLFGLEPICIQIGMHSFRVPPSHGVMEGGDALHHSYHAIGKPCVIFGNSRLVKIIQSFTCGNGPIPLQIRFLGDEHPWIPAILMFTTGVQGICFMYIAWSGGDGDWRPPRHRQSHCRCQESSPCDMHSCGWVKYLAVTSGVISMFLHVFDLSIHPAILFVLSILFKYI